MMKTTFSQLVQWKSEMRRPSRRASPTEQHLDRRLRSLHISRSRLSSRLFFFSQQPVTAWRGVLLLDGTDNGSAGKQWEGVPRRYGFLLGNLESMVWNYGGHKQELGLK